MFVAHRPLGRPLCFLLLIAVAGVVSEAQTPATTTVSGTVFRADSSPAGGVLLISWPTFTTADNHIVAAGSQSSTLGTGGALSVALVPNVNATPSGSLYRVVYQLDDGTVKTEYWVVPTSSPASLADVRTTLGTTAAAAPVASRQYVDNSVASKANDSAVVHKNGNETIAGIKQFSSSPAVPAPTQSTDAANKAYVDSVAGGGGGGGGPYVSKAGDTMTGPLVLSGDPTASNQAASRHYVDTGLGSKADLVSGLVSRGQLGSGSPDGTLCLKGDSTWGACGSSSNAVSIQSVPVDTTAPADNQVITYDAASGKYIPKAGGGVSTGMQAVKYATDFNWSQSPSASLSSPGAKTVTLTTCPPGVRAAEPQYYIYIAGTGTPEAAQVTGGTCTGNGSSGTLQFTTANAHSAGYTVGSASGGLQESLIAARLVPTNPTGTSQAGKVIVPPGEFKAFARVSIRSSNITVDFSGSIVECQTTDTCIFVGDPSNSNTFVDITLVSPRGRPTVANGQAPFIEVNAQKTRIYNLATRDALSGGTFGTLVQVDNDQAFLLDGLSTSLGGSGVRCDATACNPVIYAPGPFSSFAAVGWLKNLNLNLQCQGNGVDWQSGNSLQISDSVIQGYAQYGVRAGTRRGGFSGFSLDNVYEEVGSCTNPLGNIGEAGIIAQGSGTFGVRIKAGMGPAGKVPRFSNTGTTDYRYYIVARHATFGPSNALYAGNALSDGTTAITVTTPDIAGATSFDLLRVTAVTSGLNQAPFGTGNFAVATSVTRASACSNGVCTFTDTQAGLSSYTVANPTYFPMLDFWPGPVVLGANSDSSNNSVTSRLFTDNALDGIVSVLGPIAPAVFASRCAPASHWTPLWVSCYGAESPTIFHEQGSFLLLAKPNQDGGGQLNLKGRLNFAQLGTGPGHIVTLSDANFAKTIATANNRPANDANDSYIGYDQANGDPTQVGISFGAPKSISNYIGNAGNGTSWLERLTSNLKEFKTNVQMDAGLTLAGSVQTTGPWTLEGPFGTMTAAGTSKSKLGFGAGGKLQVSESGGTVFEVAKLDGSGNFPGNASTATQLAATPSQCSGSFATGIQANGNANCSIADLMQLAETTAPTGIASYGLFWFDSTCHCPKVISNNGQAVQLGLLNVFNSDANTLEEYNSTNPQTLNIYGTRTDASNYERVGFTYDSTNQYYIADVEKAGTGTQRGFGIKLQGSIRWAWDTSFNFKPFSDNNRDIGTSSLRVRDFYLGRNLIMSSVASTYNGRTTAGPGLVALYGSPVSSTGNTAAISSTSLCSTTSCPAGQYVVDYYVDSTVSCSTAGSAAVSVTLGWTDETSAKTLQLPLNGVGVSGGNSMALGNTSNFGSGSFSLWSAGGAAITYSTSYTACTTGSGTYALRVAVRQVQ